MKGAVLLVLGLLATSPAADAQPAAARTYRIGVLGNQSAPPWDAFRQGLRELGYVEGRNATIEARWSQGVTDRLPALAVELVINLKTAKALGLTIPQSVLIRADELIQ